MLKPEFDAVIVGSGPNGLSAAITLQQAGLSVLILEAADTVGGGLRSKECTLPGYIHDVCSAIHPMAVSSPFFNSLPLEKHGYSYVYPPHAAAHPFDNGTAAILKSSPEETASLLGNDKAAYLELMKPMLEAWPLIARDVLGPLTIPRHPLLMAQFGLKALSSATQLAKRFATKEARGLWAGMAAHSIQPLTHLTTSAIGLVLMAAGHLKGWPIAKGGSQSIANALAAYF